MAIDVPFSTFIGFDYSSRAMLIINSEGTVKVIFPPTVIASGLKMFRSSMVPIGEHYHNRKDKDYQ